MVQVVCSVARNGRAPILFLPKGKTGTYGEGLPRGAVQVRVDGKLLMARVAKIAINVVSDAAGRNVLPSILMAWYGVDAGTPGKRGRVQLRTAADGFLVMEPVSPCEQGIAA